MKLKQITLPLLHATVLFAAQISAMPSFVKIRPQYTNTPHELFFSNNCLPWIGSFYVAAKYTESFDEAGIANYLFGADAIHYPFCSSSIKIEGSTYNNGTRNPKAWLADYFGLSPNFASTINFAPRVQQIIIPIHASWEWESGVYAQLELTAAHAQWQLNPQETIINEGSAAYNQGYFNTTLVPRANLLNNALSFFDGKIPDLGTGIIFQPLACSRISRCTNAQSGIAGVEGLVGMLFVDDEYAQCGVHLRAVAPTNYKSSCDLFSPIIGNGGHWAGGLGIDAAINLAQRNQYCWGLALNAYVQHLFSTQQTRCFDLNGKPNSRYMLAQKLGITRGTPRLTGASDAGVEFQNEFAPVANITKAQVSVSIPVEAEFTALLSLNGRHVHLGIGYNLWAQSAEKICIQDKCAPALINQQWGLKGDAQVIGFELTTGAPPVRLAAIQDASIHSGTNNFPNGIGGVPFDQNPGVLNPQTASTGAPNNVSALPNESDAVPLYTSAPAPTLKKSMLNLGGTRAFSQKIFGTLSFTGNEHGTRHHWMPFLSIGAEAEWGLKDHPNCYTNSTFDCGSSVYNFAVNEWGAWISIGMSVD